VHKYLEISIISPKNPFLSIYTFFSVIPEVVSNPGKVFHFGTHPPSANVVFSIIYKHLKKCSILAHFLDTNFRPFFQKVSKFQDFPGWHGFCNINRTKGVKK